MSCDSRVIKQQCGACMGDQVCKSGSPYYHALQGQMSWGGNSRYKIEISISDAIKLFLTHNPSMVVKKPFESEVQFFTKHYDKGYDYYRSQMEESLPGQVNTCIGWEKSVNFFFTSKTIIGMILFKCVFLPEASLAIGYCRCLRLSVHPCGNHLLVRVITRDQFQLLARITKFGS